jgi:hypothetical protein
VFEETDFQGLLRHFKTTFPSLFSGDAIICDSERYRDNLTRRLRYFDSEIVREARSTISDINPNGDVSAIAGFSPFLDDFFATENDFSTYNASQAVYLSTSRFELELRAAEGRNLELVTKLSSGSSTRQTPLIYLHSEGKRKSLFLVQHVRDGDASRAATVALYWTQNKVNLGYHAVPIADTDAVTVLDFPNLKIENPSAPMVVELGSGETIALLSLNDVGL